MISGPCPRESCPELRGSSFKIDVIEKELNGQDACWPLRSYCGYTECIVGNTRGMPSYRGITRWSIIIPWLKTACEEIVCVTMFILVQVYSIEVIHLLIHVDCNEVWSTTESPATIDAPFYISVMSSVFQRPLSMPVSLSIMSKFPFSSSMSERSEFEAAAILFTSL